MDGLMRRYRDNGLTREATMLLFPSFRVLLCLILSPLVIPCLDQWRPLFTICWINFILSFIVSISWTGVWRDHRKEVNDGTHLTGAHTSQDNFGNITVFGSIQDEASVRDRACYEVCIPSFVTGPIMPWPSCLDRQATVTKLFRSTSGIWKVN